MVYVQFGKHSLYIWRTTTESPQKRVCECILVLYTALKLSVSELNFHAQREMENSSIKFCALMIAMVTNARYLWTRVR